MVAEDPAEAALTALNATLQQLGQPYKSALVDPSSLKELDKSAHYMTHEMFQNLVANIQRDGALASVPLCWYDGSTSFAIKNHAVALSIGLDVFERSLTDLQPGWFQDGQAKHKGQVPLATMFGSDKVPANVACLLKEACAKMRQQGLIESGDAGIAIALPPRHEDVQPRLSRGLHYCLPVLGQECLMQLAGDCHHIREERLAGVQVEQHEVGPVKRPDAGQPWVERERSLVHQVEEGGQVVYISGAFQISCRAGMTQKRRQQPPEEITRPSSPWPSPRPLLGRVSLSLWESA
jgi:hypothetical protein